MQRRHRPAGKARRKCPSRKIRFDNEFEANKAIQPDRGDGRKVPVRSYPCSDCHGWHHTSQEYTGKDWTGFYQCCGGTVGAKHELSCDTVSPEEFFARTGGRVNLTRQEMEGS